MSASVEKLEGRFDKKQNKALAFHTYTGPITVVDCGTQKDVDAAAKAIKDGKGALGVTVQRASGKQVGLVAVATEEPAGVFLLRTHTPDAKCNCAGLFTAALNKEREGTKYIVGGDSSADGKKFKETFEIELSSLGDTVILDSAAAKKNVKVKGQVKLASHFGYFLDVSPAVVTSDWDAEALSDEQKKLAADAVYYTMATGLKIAAAEPEKEKKEKREPRESRGKVGKVNKLTAETKDLALKVTVAGVKTIAKGKGKGKGPIVEATVGDSSGCVQLELEGEQVDLVRTGQALALSGVAGKLIKDKLVITATVEVTHQESKHQANDKVNVSAPKEDGKKKKGKKEKEEPKEEPKKGKGKGKKEKEEPKEESKKGKGKGKGKKEKEEPKNEEKTKPKRAKFHKLKQLDPDSSELNFKVTVSEIKTVKASKGKGKGKGGIVEAKVGDDSGCVWLTLKGAQVDKAKVGQALTLTDASVKMFKGYIRLVAGDMEVTHDQSKHKPNLKNDCSATEYELVRAN